MSTRSSVAVILICGFTSLLLAQAPPAPPKPGPEHKKLEYFVGKWTVEDEIKPNGYVPAGKTVGTETDTLGPGGFYVESRAEGQLPTRLAIIAYDSDAKVCTSYTPTASDSWAPPQDRLTEILGRGWRKTSLRAKPSKEELQSRRHHPLSTHSSMKWPTKRAVTQPS